MEKSNNCNDGGGTNAANNKDVSQELKAGSKQIEAPKERCLEKPKKHWKKASAKVRKKYRPPGRPPKFKTADDLYEALLAYFEQCDERTTKRSIRCDGKEILIDVPDPAPKEVTQMCRFLGISRRTWYNYNQPGHPFYIYCEWFDAISQGSWFEAGEDPRKTSLAIFVLRAKFRKETRMLEKKESANLLKEIDGAGFILPCDELDSWNDNLQLPETKNGGAVD